MINAIGLIGGILMILALKLNCQEILMAARRVVKYFSEIPNSKSRYRKSIPEIALENLRFLEIRYLNLRFFCTYEIFSTLTVSVLVIFHGFAMLLGFFSLILKMNDKEGVFWSFLFIALEIPVLVLLRV